MTGISIAERLNRECDCAATDLGSLRRELDDALDRNDGHSILETHPHLFSDAAVFVDPAHLRDMRRLIDTVNAIALLPGYQEAALADAPLLARLDYGTHGAFTAFDFHISADGPRLIEINTNAGGALLNAAARRAQPPCCPAAEDFLERRPDAEASEARIVGMFEHEWRLARGDTAALRTIAIVDDEPEQQYLYPELLLFKRLFEARGIETFIVNAKALVFDAGGLTHRGQRIDLVYNRLTDFYFESPEHRAIAAAYAANAAVVTPHPRAHALLANKRNLVRLTDADFLRSIGAQGPHIETLLAMIPRTLPVTGCDAGWWATRKDWFFKPAQGFGSRGTYRGDKLTRRVFAEIMKGQYVAQEFAPPGERWRTTSNGRQSFKVDVRAYVYEGLVQQVAARLYQGQTTNFRTTGGGFAPVYEPKSRRD